MQRYGCVGEEAIERLDVISIANKCEEGKYGDREREGLSKQIAATGLDVQQQQSKTK
jgi:hypothetical protein